LAWFPLPACPPRHVQRNAAGGGVSAGKCANAQRQVCSRPRTGRWRAPAGIVKCSLPERWWDVGGRAVMRFAGR